MDGAVTFDFHDTLARCDGWFGLEVRHLAAALLRWQAARTGAAVDPSLAQAAESAYRRLRLAIIEHGNELPAEECAARVLTEIGAPLPAPAIARGVEELMRQTLDETAPVDGAIETVQSLAAAGVKLGIVSSAVYHPFLDWTLERFGIRAAFAAVTTSASAGYYKSRPELYRHAIDRLGVTANHSVHVGDSYRFDVAGARRIGMKTVWYRPDPARPVPGHDPTRPPDLTVATLVGAAPTILDLLNGRDRRGGIGGPAQSAAPRSEVT
jgi:HAD superfamily hydrolase (TIGR01549 family)